jgi:hypothetical protein
VDNWKEGKGEGRKRLVGVGLKGDFLDWFETFPIAFGSAT